MSDFKLPNLENLMEAAQKIQGEVARMQEDLANRTVEASSGGGMVTVKINGHYELVTISIDKEAVDPNELGMLQDLIIAALIAAGVLCGSYFGSQLADVLQRNKDLLKIVFGFLLIYVAAYTAFSWFGREHLLRTVLLTVARPKSRVASSLGSVPLPVKLTRPNMLLLAVASV